VLIIIEITLSPGEKKTATGRRRRKRKETRSLLIKHSKILLIELGERVRI
jgi:hypothetical protein